jgi:hypothetical protein
LTALIERKNWDDSIVHHAFVIAIVSIALFAATLVVTGPELTWDSMDAAQIARQQVRRQVPETKFLAVADPELPENGHRLQWRNQFRSSIFVGGIWASFFAFGFTDYAVVAWSGLFYVLTCFAVLAIGRQCFSPTVAVLSAIVFAASRPGLMFARSGLSEPAAMFFLAAAIWSIGRRSLAAYVGAGALLGLGWATRPTALLWMAGAVFFLMLSEKRRVQSVLALITGFAVPVVVILVTTGAPSGAAAVATNLAMRVADPHDALRGIPGFIAANYGQLMLKWVHEALRPVVYMFRIGDVPLISGLLPVSVLVTERESQNQLRFLVGLIIAMNWFVLSFLYSGDAFAGPLRYYDVFAPVLIPFAVQLILRMLSGVRPAIVVALWAVFLAGLMYQSVKNPFPLKGRTQLHSDIAGVVAQHSVVGVTESLNPPSFAWYSDRFVVLANERAFDEFRSRGIQISYKLQRDTETRSASCTHVVRTWPGGIVLYRCD